MIFPLLLVVTFLCATVDAGGKIAVSKESNKGLKKNLDSAEAAFAIKLGKLLNEELKEKNVVYSPLSIFNALVLILLGLEEGATRDELASFLGFSKNPASLLTSHQYFSRILNSVKHSEGVTVNIAAGLFVSNGISLKEQFLEDVKTYYNSEVTNVAFDSNSGTDFINNWISNKTNGRIPKLYFSSLPANTKLVLSSALYFAANWLNPFSKELIKPDKFNTGFSVVDVKMLTNEKTIPYTDNPSLRFRAIGLDYEKKEFTLYIVLPYEGELLTNVIKNLEPQHIRQIVGATQDNITKIEYKIPYVKYSWNHDLDTQLTTLGIGKLFSSPILTKSASDSLVVSNVKHAADIEFTESGTIASAVTVIGVSRVGLELSVEDPIKFYVDKPFAFFIYHHETNSILFKGWVYNPLE
ncbi:hypothetical protein PGB90_002999 [Kerria lacca]